LEDIEQDLQLRIGGRRWTWKGLENIAVFVSFAHIIVYCLDASADLEKHDRRC
jgi:hypothetical protein